MSKSVSKVYQEWKASILTGFTSADLNVCPKGSTYYLGLSENGIEPLLVSRTLSSELFNVWYGLYTDLLKKAPVGVVPVFTHFFAVSPVDRDNWSVDEFDMVNIADSSFIKPVLGTRTYAKFTLPTLEGVVELCNRSSNAQNGK